MKTPNGVVVFSLKDIEKKIKLLKTSSLVLKAQIHAGGRGKAGGIKIVKNKKELITQAKILFGKKLITHQTGPEGKKVNKVLITEAYDIKKEYYVAITLDRSKKKDVFMVSSEGGVNIEEVAKKTPEKIIKVWIDSTGNLNDNQATELGRGLGFTNELLTDSNIIFKNLYKCYKEMDCTILEVNPLITTSLSVL